MDIADGDFTKRGVVSEDALGNVVDAINLMVEELGGLLRDVQQAALSVNEGAGEMIGSSGAIAQSAERTAGEAQRVRAQVEKRGLVDSGDSGAGRQRERRRDAHLAGVTAGSRSGDQHAYGDGRYS